MKKYYSIFILAVVILFAGCSKSDSKMVYPDAVQQKIIASIMAAGSAGGNPQLVAQKQVQLRSGKSYPFDLPIDQTIPGESGGTVKVTGRMTGVINDDGSSSFTMNMNEAFSGYTVVVDGANYANSGNITYSGTMSSTANGSASAHFLIGGTIATIGPNYNKSFGMNLQINEQMNGSAMTSTVSGTIDGIAVNYTYAMK